MCVHESGYRRMGAGEWVTKAKRKKGGICVMESLWLCVSMFVWLWLCVLNTGA